MRYLLCVAACGWILSCSPDRERASHIAVKSLAAAPQNKVPGEMARVLSFGRYALPDIEQEIHGASIQGRLRLLEALSRLKDKEAIPLLDTLARWDADPEVRKRAHEVARELLNASR
jgi:hypothetical protein